MITLSNGMEVHVSVMHAYPDGCLLAAELSGIILPALSELPKDLVDTAQALASGAIEGKEADAASSAARARLVAIAKDGEASDRVYRGIAKALVGLADRARFERVSQQLLSTLTVKHGGLMINLSRQSDIQTVVGSNLKLVLELLYVALKENFLAFFSGGGDTNAEASSAQTRRA